MARILIVEDEASIADVVARGLAELGYKSATARDADEADRLLEGARFDLIILDLMLPGRSGVSFCKALRERGVATPVLMLTALSSTQNKVEGLDAGADDYLVKPFEFDELAARIKALVRRFGGDKAVMTYEDLEIDQLKRTVTRGGKRIRLTSKEFSLLAFLVSHAGRPVTRREIGQAVWEMDIDYGGNVIEVYISSLRRKVDKGFPVPLIHTVVGVGYVLGTNQVSA